MKISVVVTTFNSPLFLAWVIESILWQTKLPNQIVIADDGSDARTAGVVHTYREKSPIPIVHSYQPDNGFRLARSRNLATLKTTGRWIIFLDGDCVLPPNFILRQSCIAKPGKLLFCARKLVTGPETQVLMKVSPSLEAVDKFFSGRKFRRVYLGFFRQFPERTWRQARGFLMCVAREDIERIQGFDENYHSWGLEDSDFVLRAQRSGVKLSDARYLVSLLHLNHEEPCGGAKSENWNQFKNLLSETFRTKPSHSIFSAMEG